MPLPTLKRSACAWLLASALGCSLAGRAAEGRGLYGIHDADPLPTDLDNGSNQGTAWRNPGFNDAAWSSGRARVGFGDGDEATVVRGNRGHGSRIITTYFRRAFEVADRTAFSGLSLRLLRDDGAVVCLNGSE